MPEYQSALLNQNIDLENFLDNFSDFVTRDLGRHRKYLGISREQIADFFKVNVSTIRKWECGCTRRCHERHAVRLFRFLRGDYDCELQDKLVKPIRLTEAMRNVPSELHDILLRAIRVFPLLSDNPSLQHLFLQRLNLANSEILERSIEAAR